MVRPVAGHGSSRVQLSTRGVDRGLQLRNLFALSRTILHNLPGSTPAILAALNQDGTPVQQIPRTIRLSSARGTSHARYRIFCRCLTAVNHNIANFTRRAMAGHASSPRVAMYSHDTFGLGHIT